MDHVQLPQNPVHPPIEVPYLCTEAFDGGPFHLYPYLKGWSERDVFYRPNWTRQPPFDSDDIPDRRSAGEAISFLQNWLFFGLLVTVFGPDLDTRDFRRNKDGHEFVTTIPLPVFSAALVEREKELKATKALEVMMQGRQRQLDTCLRLAHEVFAYICYDTSLEPAVLLSIGALGDYLTNVRNLIYCETILPDSELVLAWPNGCVRGLEADLLAKRMLQDGWCRSEVRRLYRFSPSAMYFVSNLDRPGPDKDHRDKCNRFQCVAYQIDNDAYSTEHVPKGCGCKHIYAEQGQLYSILKSGVIPLISTSCAFEEDVPLEIIPAKPDTRYVAISHVWSDGLGNPLANSLPRCQLVHIARLVNQLYGPTDPPIPFWMDTICCPTEPEAATDLAIILMRKTYREADKVLVLENYLRFHPAEPMSEFERMARIFCSSWTQRLWTLQEGVLARSLFIQFADTALNFNEAYLSMVQTEGTQSEVHSLIGFFRRIRGEWALVQSPVPFATIQGIVIALHERSTSVATDEALCLGTLTDIDMEKLMEVPPEARMKRFWSLQAGYTGDMIFWTGCRMEDEGYRWAPASFMHQILELLPGGLDSNSKSMAHRTDEGLMVKYPGVILGTFQDAPIARKFWLRDEKKEWRYWMACTARRDGGDESGGIICSPTTDVSQPITVALIFRDPPSTIGLDPLGFPYACAALVSIRKRKEGILFARLEKTGNVYPAVDGKMPGEQLASALALRTQLASLYESKATEARSEDTGSVVFANQHRVFDGEWLGNDQQWCVD
ncbi:MAG: hypothetical protein M1830_002482 [Pleopsidium flavum]|nr:MAG: hypothetical protein M1830_002482 [Pleopsidium flavum]